MCEQVVCSRPVVGTVVTAEEIEADIRANLNPGVVVVPAMVIAIEKAQTAGIRYNRQ